MDMDAADKNSDTGAGAPPGAVVGGRDGTSSEEESDVMDDVSRASMDDEFLKHAEIETGENLSDQTPGGLCLYDCSLSTPTDKSLSHFSHTFNDGAASNKHIHDLSCSMLMDNSHCISKLSCEEMVHSLAAELQKKNKLIKDLCTTLDLASDEQESGVIKAKNLASEVSVIKENFEDLTNLSSWSFDLKRDENPVNPPAENFRLSSYMRKLPTQNENIENPGQYVPHLETVQETRSAQTSPGPCTLSQVAEQPLDRDFVKSLCISFFSVTKGLRDELNVVRDLMRQPYENHQDFPMQKIMTAIQEITKCHETEISSSKDQLAAEVKHHHEVQCALKDEIKTLKMRLQEKAKQRDNEVAELKARLLEATDVGELQFNENVNAGNIDQHRQPVDEPFNSNSEEETFSNLTRMKVEYLKLTPSEYVEDEIIDTVHIPDSYRQILEDYKLKLFDMEKKFDANRRYLEEQTHDREVERDEFQQALESLQNQIEELRRENGKLYEINKQNIYQMEEYDARLKSAEEDEMDMIQKHEKAENELKSAVEKIFELREIIRDLEKQVDAMSTSAIQLKEQNQVLLDELDKQEIMNKKEQPVFNEQDSYATLPVDVTDEIQTQLHDLAKKIEFKISEMDNFPLHTRPNSSCSGVASAVSTEDISCRELAGRSSRNYENFPIEDIGALLLNEIRRLENQFESLIRFEDVIMKKMKDSELRCGGQKAKMEELEGQVSIYQEKCSSQMLKIADLEGKIDSLRFESLNQGVIVSLKSRLGIASKQLEEYKILLASKEQELSQVKLELNSLKIKQVEMKAETKEMASQTSLGFDRTIFSDFTCEGVSPEKIRRLDSANTLNASVISLPNNAIREGHGVSFEPEPPQMKSFDMTNRSGVSSDSGRRGRGDGDNSDSYDNDRENSTIKELDENLLELQKLLTEKDKMIRSLKNELGRGDAQTAMANRDHRHQKPSEKPEEENVTIDIDLDGQGRQAQKKKGQALDGTSGVYEIMYASDYDVNDGLLKYIGTKLVYDGVKKDSSMDHGQGRVQETDLQIEIATLNTQIQQLKRALEEERKRSDNLSKQLKSCEEAKAELRSRSPSTRAPVQKAISSQSISDLQLQQRELMHQIEEGRATLNNKQKEVISLTDQIANLETRLNGKVEYEQELLTRLNSTSASLRRCEEHGRELSTKNLENIKEIRRLRDQMDKLHANSRNSENYPVSVSGSGSEYFENFMRAKSHKKALAWQKKYLTTVIVGYKSILRQVGHGSEHPELLYTQIPLAPHAVGLLDKRSPKRDFRVGALVVLATIRMKYMVNRWHKKRTVEGSPDSEYSMSRHPSRIDQNIVRPGKGILVHTRNNPNVLPFSASSAPSLNNNSNLYRPNNGRGNIDEISEYLSRFESIENEISSSLSRNLFPS